MPGAKQTKHLAAKIAREQPIHLVQPPDKVTGKFLQHFPAQESLKIGVRTAPRVPDVFRQNGEVQLVRQELTEDAKERLDRREMGGVELLEIRQGNFGAGL